MTGTASDTTTGVALGAAGTGDSGSDGNSGSSQATGTQATQTGNAGSEGSGSSVWYGSVEDASLKSLAESKGWKSPADALKSYKELETAFSARQEGPKPAENVDAYKFTVPSDIPKEAYNEGFANWFKEAAFKNKLSVEQAAAVHDAFVEYAKGEMSSSASASAKKLQESIQTAAQDLESAWGKMNTPQFARNVELARRAIRMADPGLMDALREVGVIQSVNGQDMVANATIMKAFAKMGEGMYSEDQTFGNAAEDKNPFDDKTQDLAMQGRLIRQDPDKAAMLIRAAGKEKMFSQFLQSRKGK